MNKRKLRMGMIGGGKDAFIGAIHRLAINMDGQVELVCGALSVNPETALESGKLLFLPDDRTYTSYVEMLDKEAARPPHERIDFVTIVTPNFAHFAPAMKALECGFNVVIEKPITFTLEEAKQLQAKLAETGLMLLLTHTYAGYPLVKEAREIIKSGKLGKVRKIYVEYLQGWLSRLSEREGNAQASWRTDPSKSGKAGCMGDIGTHAAHLAEHVSGLKITALNAALTTVVNGRMLDDDGAVLLKFEQEVTGTLIASQVAAGEENSLRLRIYGENGGLEWSQMEPNTLTLRWLDKPAETLRAGSGYTDRLSTSATSNCRTPGGHPEGYLEAFANLYKNFVLALGAKIEGREPQPEWLDFPSIDEGIRGMAFIDNVVASNASDEKWTTYTV
ncbi:Gfo/Idh/MocA family protein [Mucilaginibacter myungsuensis]|uniref:Gfo/Idh/MocA family oxidoreductase n=1 Tax=Mucilaginibacter myungsuensis TaxID=649104 RepID=A0A929PUY0_9SPHI|nr:Gfo/Idh/MocA family oxidoreductase [Mucilaginibacter myungsuensis]MBE9660411.1 Gfo/Idh/MocA family oxidoreductase [Mucilaginibacter myungsuensis]MDN3600453.1 Gfo/Idh/MocA family oxidoreductase [Mucilaginibacter myungsuensis]